MSAQVRPMSGNGNDPGIQLNWADWIALGAGVTLSAFLLLLVLLVFVAAGSTGATHLMDNLATKAIELDFLVTGLIWITLRGINSLARMLVRSTTSGLNRQTQVPQLAKRLAPGFRNLP